MALADTAALVATLELKDQFSRTASNAERALGRLETKTSRLSTIGSEASRGLQNATRNIGVGLVAGGFLLTTQIKSGIDSLVELSEATEQTAARIESTGGAANVTADQVRDLAKVLEDKTTIDDKAIQRGENMLLTFKDIRNEVGEGNDIFNQATESVLDLSTAMGTEPEQAALQLGKALNDPVRGLTALRRVGVQFTEAQEDQIRKMVEAGDKMGAQKIILRELNEEFGGSARAFAEGPGAVQRRFTDAVEEGQQALARGLLPVIERFSQMAQDAFGDPKVIAGIERFGEGLGEGLEQLIDIATRLPWDAIGNTFEIMGKGSKALLDAFTGLPDWVQTAVLTGWGLNKLTGGALGNIVGELGKMAFGALRGATPANPVFVADVAGGAGAATGGAPVAATGSRLATAAKFVLGPAAAILIGTEIAKAVNDAVITPAKDFEERKVTAVLEGGNVDSMVRALATIDNQLTNGSPLEKIALGVSDIPIIGDALGNAADTLDAQRELLRDQLIEQGYTNDQIDAMIAAQKAGTDTLDAGLDRVRGAAIDLSTDIDATRVAVRDLRSPIEGLARVEARVEAAVRGTAAGTAQHLREIAGLERGTQSNTAAIARKDFSPRISTNVSVTSNVSISDILRQSITQHVATDLRGGWSEI